MFRPLMDSWWFQVVHRLTGGAHSTQNNCVLYCILMQNYCIYVYQQLWLITLYGAGATVLCPSLLYLCKSAPWSYHTTITVIIQTCRCVSKKVNPWTHGTMLFWIWLNPEQLVCHICDECQSLELSAVLSHMQHCEWNTVRRGGRMNHQLAEPCYLQRRQRADQTRWWAEGKWCWAARHLQPLDRRPCSGGVGPSNRCGAQCGRRSTQQGALTDSITQETSK